MTKTVIEKADIAERTVPSLDPRDQMINRSTFAFCKMPSGDVRQYWHHVGAAYGEAFIVAPAGMRASDLNEAPRACWSKIQSNPALRLSAFDRATIVCADLSWMAQGLVLAADGQSVTFKPTAVIADLPQPAPAKPTHTSSEVQQTRVRA